MSGDRAVRFLRPAWCITVASSTGQLVTKKNAVASSTGQLVTKKTRRAPPTRYFHDKWNRFDFCVVFLAYVDLVFPLGSIAVLRLLRLLKVTRGERRERM